MAINFWIPSMQLIREFALKASARLFGRQAQRLQTSFYDYLYSLMLQSVFEGRMQLSNCRHMLLIPAMSYQIFLKRHNHHFPVVLTTHSTKNKKIRREYVKCTKIRHDALRHAFHAAMNQYLSSIRVQSIPNGHGKAFASTVSTDHASFDPMQNGNAFSNSMGCASQSTHASSNVVLRNQVPRNSATRTWHQTDLSNV
eukprot:331469_1